MIILRCLTSLNLNWIQNDHINLKRKLEEKNWKFKFQKWQFFDYLWSFFFGKYIPYVPPSSCYFQIGIWSPKQHLFDREFCVGLCQTLCKQWVKGFCKILKFWPLHSVRQNVAGFRRGLSTCFLGHTSLSPAFWATPHYNSCGPKSR